MLAYTFPGESARLLTVWNGLDDSFEKVRPLMGFFARPFGLTNGLSWALVALAAVLLGWLALRAVRLLATGEDTAVEARPSSWIAALAAGLVFAVSSATLASLSRIEPALFALVMTLIAFHALLGALCVGSALVYLLIPLVGLFWGFVAVECSFAVVVAPLAAILVVVAIVRGAGGMRAFGALALFGFGALGGFLAYTAFFASDFAAAMLTLKRGILAQFVLTEGGATRAVFALLPFLATLLLMPGAFGNRVLRARVVFGHLAILVLSIFGLFADYPSASVVSLAFVAFAVAETLAYLFVSARVAFRNRRPLGTRFRNFNTVSRAILAVVLVGCAAGAAVRAVVLHDASVGAFADRFAGAVLDELGDRTWLVTDGRLDDHLRIEAARRGRDIVFVNIGRDLDPMTQKALAAVITQRLGDRAPALLRSLDLGILPFLEDWIKADPAATNEVAVFGAPDVLVACGAMPVPGVTLFGSGTNPSTETISLSDLVESLAAPKGWGSAHLADERDPLTRLRFDLRRHLGLVANNRAVALQDGKDDDGAARLYSLVLDDIDSDNISALFNLLTLADGGFAPARARQTDLRVRAKRIVADESRRYRLWALANYYGTVRNVPALLGLGYAWAKSGRPGEALAQIRRAADLIPSDQRANLMVMMAFLLADADRHEEARKVYERRLAGKPDDHATLMGLVRLELLAGDEVKAQAYLQRAVAAGGDDPRIKTELALLKIMNGDASAARDILKSITVFSPSDVRAWSLLAAVTMQLSDAAKDELSRAVLDRELEEIILPKMKGCARGADAYYVRSTEAFLALRKGEAGRKSAQTALIAATQLRPDVPVTREMLIGVDIALNDPVAAESHAREILRRDRNSPMANYVMGSLALGKGDLADAEAYLRKAVATKKPSAFALNDLSETLRLKGSLDEAETFARRVVAEFPALYAGWDTLANVILDRKGDAQEALACVQKSVELVTKDGRTVDAGVLLTLARAQLQTMDRRLCGMTLRKLESRLAELNDRQRREYDAALQALKSAK